MDSSQFKGGAGRFAISRSAIENYPRWIPMAEIDSTSLGKKRIFAIVSRPIGGKPKGKAIKRIVIFDNHPESLRLLLQSGLDSDNDDATARSERRGSIICGFILIAIVLAALLWVLY